MIEAAGLLYQYMISNRDRLSFEVFGVSAQGAEYADEEDAEIAARRARGDWAPRRGIDEATIRMWAYEAIGDRGEPGG